MARSPYTGVPESVPQVEQPQDQIRVQASPAAFGAGLAQGAEDLGKGALDLTKFYGQVSADEATNNLLQHATTLLYGDPSKPAVDANGQPIMGPDGKPMPDTGYFGKRGADAMRAAPEIQKQLDQFINDQRSGLLTPMARQQFDVESRRYRAQYMSRVGEYADAQSKVWAADTFKTGATVALNQIAADPLNVDAVAVGAANGQEATLGDRVRQAYVRNAQMIEGADPEGAVLKANQDITLARIRSLIGRNDGVNAQKVFDANQGILGSMPNFDQVSHAVKEAAINQNFGPSLMAFQNDVKTRAEGQVGPGGTAPNIDAVAQAIGVEEWHGKGPAPVSSMGAVGNSQILPATAKLHGLDPDKLTDPAYAAMAKKKILSDIAARPDVQGDPARMAVGYFSGEANIAPLNSPTPWKHDTSDGHENVSDYVAHMTSRLAKYPSTAAALMASQTSIHDQAVAKAAELFPGYPDVQQRWVAASDRETEQQVAVYHRQYDVDLQIVQGAMLNHPISVEELTQDPQVADAWQRLQGENPLGVKGIESQFDANAKGAARVYGAGFKSYADRVLGPQGDANAITNPAQIWPYVGKGEDAVLTNTGANQLTALMQLRQGPHGEANIQAIKGFMDQAHGNLTFSNPQTGVYDEKGEARFAKFMAVALPIMEHAAKAGKLAEVLNPQSKDYVGLAAAPFTRSGAELRRDQLDVDNPLLGVHHPLLSGPQLTVQSLGDALRSLDNDQQRADAVNDFLKSGRLNAATYNAWYASANPGPVRPGQFGMPPTPSVRVVPGGK